MTKRFLTSTPKEILTMDRGKLLEAIKLSEGRIITVAARTRGPNIVDGVSNAEVAAAFGADLVLLDTYNVHNPYVPGLPDKRMAGESKTVEDTIEDQVQITLGRGWTLKEIRGLIGRPVGILLAIPPEGGTKGLKKHYGDILATRENAKLAVKLGADIIFIAGWGETKTVTNIISGIRDEVENKVILSFSRVHGPGLIGELGKRGRDLITEGEIKEFVKAGADIVSLPAPGTFYGWTIDYTCKFVDIIHECGALAAVGLHTSQEGSDLETIRRLAIYAKMSGAEIYELGDSGFTESMIPPENILAFSIAVRGRRHTYRRMATSLFR